MNDPLGEGRDMARTRLSQNPGKDPVEQVDPFNAGEPVLPWDDPEAWHDDECRFEEAEERGAERKPAREHAAERKAKPNRRAECKAKPDRDLDRKAKAAEDQMRADAERARAYYASKSKECAVRAAAHKKGKAGRTVGVVLVVIFVLQFSSAIISCTKDLFFDNTTNSFSSSYSSTASSSSAYDELDADEQEMVGILAARMDDLANDSEMLALVGEGLSQRTELYMDYSAEELGLDTSAYASWFFQNFTYELSTAYAWSDGTGSVSFDVFAPDSYAVAEDLYDRAADYLYENNLTGDDSVPLTSEQQDQMRSYFAETLNEVPVDGENWISIDFSLVDGSWVLDEEDFSTEKRYLAGLY